jgi:hypothetical protein
LSTEFLSNQRAACAAHPDAVDAPQSDAVAASARQARAIARPAATTLVLGAILLFGLAARLLVAFTMPAWQSPDEPKHFEYIRVLTDLRARLWAERRLPRLTDDQPKLQRDIIVSLAENHYWDSIHQPTPKPLPTRFINVWPDSYTQLHRPSLYYFLAAPILLPFTSADLDTQLRIVRLVSVVISMLTLWVVYLTARVAVPNDPFVPLAGLAFAAALPMHVYINASINNDNLEGLFGSLVCLGLVWGLRRGFSLKVWLLVLVAFGLGLLTKRGIVGLGPVIGLAGLLWLPSLRGWRLGLGLAAIGLAVCIGLAGLDAVGPMLGPGKLVPAALREKLIAYALNDPGQVLRLLQGDPHAQDVVQLILGHQWLLFWGFWGAFGWYSVLLPPAAYTWLAIVTGVCTLGFVVWLGQQGWAARRRGAGAVARRNVLVGLLCLAATIVMLVLTEGERLAYFTAAQIPQGRYLFVVIGPIALALALGVRTLLPARWLGMWLPLVGVMGALVLFDVYVYVGYLLPFFRTGVPVFIPA